MTMKLLSAYLFKDKNPSIDLIRTIVQDHFGGTINHKVLKYIEDHGGPVVSTTNGWFNGKTKRPMDHTLEACGRSIGYERRWVKVEGKPNGKGKKKTSR